jgi:hypothetical protein
MMPLETMGFFGFEVAPWVYNELDAAYILADEFL